MAIFGHLAVSAVGQTANFRGQEFAAATGLPLALLRLGGNANGDQFGLIAFDRAGEPHAHGAVIEFVGLASAIRGDGRDEKTLRARFHQLAMEHETKAALFGDGIILQNLRDPFRDLLEPLRGSEFARGLG